MFSFNQRHLMITMLARVGIAQKKTIKKTRQTVHWCGTGRGCSEVSLASVGCRCIIGEAL
jgi:hypothetical protein